MHVNVVNMTYHKNYVTLRFFIASIKYKYQGEYKIEQYSRLDLTQTLNRNINFNIHTLNIKTK